jgi:hypothetical protein
LKKLFTLLFILFLWGCSGEPATKTMPITNKSTQKLSITTNIEHFPTIVSNFRMDSVKRSLQIREGSFPVYNLKIEFNLIHTESKWKIFAKSEKEAVGLYQITKCVVDDYNTFAIGTKDKDDWLDLKDMYKIYYASVVYNWQINRLWRCDWPTTNDNDKWVYCINSWNMGRSNTLIGRYNHLFCSNIIPDKWAEFSKDKRWRKYPKTWRLLPPVVLRVVKPKVAIKPKTVVKTK